MTTIKHALYTMKKEGIHIDQRVLVELPPNGDFVKWRDCPKCQGMGLLLINPFLTGGQDGLGGLRNRAQCKSCMEAYNEFKSGGD